MALAGLLLGVVVAGALFFPGDPNVVRCDGEVMTTGQRCISSLDSASGTYEELLERRRAAYAENVATLPWNLLLLGFGIVVVIGTTVFLEVTDK